MRPSVHPPSVLPSIHPFVLGQSSSSSSSILFIASSIIISSFTPSSSWCVFVEHLKCHASSVIPDCAAFLFTCYASPGSLHEFLHDPRRTGNPKHVPLHSCATPSTYECVCISLANTLFRGAPDLYLKSPNSEHYKPTALLNRDLNCNGFRSSTCSGGNHPVAGHAHGGPSGKPFTDDPGTGSSEGRAMGFRFDARVLVGSIIGFSRLTLCRASFQSLGHMAISAIGLGPHRHSRCRMVLAGLLRAWRVLWMILPLG